MLLADGVGEGGGGGVGGSYLQRYRNVSTCIVSFERVTAYGKHNAV